MILFLLYAILLLGIGVWDAMRERRGGAMDSFFVNSRRSGPWLVGISIAASCVGGSATLGMAGLAWQAGTPAFWWLGSGACGLVLLCVFLARKVRQSGARTMPEMVDFWLGSGRFGWFSPRSLVSLIILPAWLAILAAQFLAMGSLTGVLAGLEPGPALLAGAALVCAYSAIGGQASVMRSDLPQFCIMLAGLALALLYLVLHNPPAAWNFRPEFVNSDFPPSRLCYFLAVIGGSYVVCPMLFGRILSARDENAALAGCRIGILGILLCAALVTFLGLAARGFVPAGTAPDNVLASAMNSMPPWVAAPLLLALLSAVLSSSDSCLVTAATVLCNDILRVGEKNLGLSCRAAACALGLLGWLLAARGHGILDLLLMANDIYVSGVVAPVFFAMILPRSLAPTEGISILAVLAGGLLGMAGAISGLHAPVYAGMAISGGIILLRASLVFRRIRQPRSA